MRSNLRTPLLLIVPDPLTRLGVLAHLKASQSHRVCGVSLAPPYAQQLCEPEQPEVIVLEVSAVARAGLVLLRDLGRLAPRASIVVIGTDDRKESVERIFQAGSRAFVHREDAPCALDLAFAAMALGERFVSRHAEQAVLAGLANRPGRVGALPGIGDAARLSDRELAVFSKLGEGHGPTRIANDLHIAVKTVETHQSRIKTKLELRNVAALRERARRWLAGPR